VRNIVLIPIGSQATGPRAFLLTNLADVRGKVKVRPTAYEDLKILLCHCPPRASYDYEGKTHRLYGTHPCPANNSI
jgi:hypothetical protein